MNRYAIFALGIGVGALGASLLMRPDNCCDRVAGGVRDRVGQELGSTAQTVGDFFGIWKMTPGLLNLFGV